MSKLSQLAAHELNRDALESVSGGYRGYGSRNSYNKQGGNTVNFNGNFKNNGDNNTFNIGNNVIG